MGLRRGPRRLPRPSPKGPTPRAARQAGLIDAPTEVSTQVLADRDYQGAGPGIRVPFRGRHLPTGPRNVNAAHARLRAPGERAIATPTTWHTLTRIRSGPTRATTTVKAILTLAT